MNRSQHSFARFRIGARAEPMSLMFSATCLERTSALVLCGSFACIRAEAWAVDEEGWNTLLRRVESRWGQGVLVPINAPSRRDDEAFVQWFARAIRCAGAIRDAVHQLGLEVRTGLHTGECEIAGSKVSGIAVHTGARIATAARPQEVLASGTDWRLFAVTST